MRRFSSMRHLSIGLVCLVVQAQTGAEKAAVQSFKVAPSYFVANTVSQKTGRMLVEEPQVSAFVQTTNGRVLFTPSGAYIGMSVPVDQGGADPSAASKRARDMGDHLGVTVTRTVVMKAGFSSAQAHKRGVVPRLEEPTAASVNFMVGSKDSWQTEIPTYDKLVYDGVWDGITLEYRGFMDHLAFKLVLEPGSDPGQIVMETGAEKLELLEDGSLRATLAGAEMVLSAPRAFQDIDGGSEAVGVTYTVLNHQQIGFRLGKYAPAKKLVIEPALTWSTLIGGFTSDSGRGIAVDSSGDVYVAGNTFSTNFPTTSGAYDESSSGNTDVFVSKLSSSGSALIYSTYLGASDNDSFCGGLVVDSSGNAYVSGSTYATGFPTTSGAYNEALNGMLDLFVTKLNSSGSALVYSTFIGSTENEFDAGIALDSSGNTYVTGYTFGLDYPTTSGAFDTSPNGDIDGFVSKLNSSGTALSYSTYLGGSGWDRGRSIAVDNSGNAYVTGETLSTDYPTTNGAYDVSQNGDHDVFVSKLNSSGTALIYSTFLGGSMSDRGHGIAVDSSSHAYITGDTQSTSYPTTKGAYAESHNGASDVFVSKLNSSGTALSYSTFIGGVSDDQPYGLAVDSSGAAYVTGYSYSPVFPTTSGAFDESQNGSCDAFVSKLNNNGTELSYSTYLGGSDEEYGFAIAVDSRGSVYATGETASSNFPTTSGAYDESFNGLVDMFVTKLVLCPKPLPQWPESVTILDIISCLP